MRDIDVRAALGAQELAKYEGDPETRIVPELGVFEGSNRVDVAVVNGALHGYEIKSERDTLSRLPAQVAAFSRVFDTVTIVAATTHLKEIRATVPRWWGIMEARSVAGGAVALRGRRAPRSNPSVDPEALAQLLWRNEALALLEREGDATGMRSKPRKVVWQAIAEQLPLEVLRARVREVLKSRAGWRSDS